MNINRLFRLIPFVITQLILLFCFLLIVNACYKYHLETEERRQLLKTVKCDKCRVLVDKKQVEPVKEVNEDEDFYEVCLKLKESKDYILIPEEFKNSILNLRERIKKTTFHEHSGYKQEYKGIKFGSDRPKPPSDEALLKKNQYREIQEAQYLRFTQNQDHIILRMVFSDDKLISYIQIFDKEIKDKKIKTISLSTKETLYRTY